MSEIKCPKCCSEHISQERRIDGDSVCMDCHYRGKPEEFRKRTNFDRITESPEALADAIVYPLEDWTWANPITGDIYPTLKEALPAIDRYLEQEADHE